VEARLSGNNQHQKKINYKSKLGLDNLALPELGTVKLTEKWCFTLQCDLHHSQSLVHFIYPN
jgi:hypothetical protein